MHVELVPLNRIAGPSSRLCPPSFLAMYLFLLRRVLSGPMRFEYHDNSKRWLNTRDGETELRDLLAKEMSEKCGVSLC